MQSKKTKLIKEESYTTRRKNLAKVLRKIFASNEITTLIFLFVLVFITTSINPNFINPNNIRAMARGLSFMMISAIGVTLTILIGQIDIAVGSVAGFGGIMVTFLASQYDIPFIPAVLITLALCAVMGVLEGIIIIKYEIPAFVASIALQYIARGIAMIITKGWPVYPIPDIMNEIGLIEPFGTSVAFISAVFLVLIGDFVLQKTVIGRQLYAIGDNVDVAKLAGINVDWVRISTFIVCCVLAGFAGMLQAFQLQTGQPTIGVGWELMCIAACAIGGVSLLGGAGSLVGTFLGMCVMSVLNNALVLLKINTHWQNVVVGAIMVAAVLFDMFRRTRKIK